MFCCYALSPLKVAVGMPVTQHPPHRSRRAALPHRAPASGQTRRHKVPAVPSRAPVAGFPGSVSGPCGIRPGSPWPAPFSPPPPPTLAHQSCCSRASSILWGCPTPCTRPSRSYPVGSPCGPGITARPDAEPPGFRTECFRACQRSPTPPGLPTPCHNGVCSVAFRVLGARRHPGLADFGAQYSACTFPCQRFVRTVTDRHA